MPDKESARQTLNKAVTHEAFRKQVVRLAKLYGYEVYWTWKSYHSPKGFLDLVMVRRERLVFAELKTEGDKPTEDQEKWLRLLTATRKAEVYLWYPHDWTEIVQILLGGRQ